MNLPATRAQPTLAQRVFHALADGAVHSGEQLAAEQAVSRSAIWKAVGVLQTLGVTIEAAPHRGYRLASPATPLAAERILERLSPAVRARVREADVAWALGSTNDALLARSPPPVGQVDFLAAEYQTAGRGRRARPWFAPPGGALCLSLGWSFAALPPGAAALSLAVGVCALRALATFGPLPVGVQWPNDLVAQGRKLGGILIELRGESAGPAFIVIGLGVNCALGAALTQQVRAAGTEPTDLATLGLAPCDRNRLAAALIDEIVGGVLEFAHSGLAPFAAAWGAADALAGQVVTVTTPSAEYVGHARGIDADGALCVQGIQGLQRFNSGEVSVRVQA